MNVFILNAGRCGSTTFIKACQHITNYTALHESRSGLSGDQRLAYPPRHIEADNRLSWLLGRLDRQFGNHAFYVRLSRNRRSSVESFVQRSEYGIMKAYRDGILLGGKGQTTAELAADYLDTVESNISLFLKDKTNKMEFRMESAMHDFPRFWSAIDAEGDLEKAIAEWQIRYNASNKNTLL